MHACRYVGLPHIMYSMYTPLHVHISVPYVYRVYVGTCMYMCSMFVCMYCTYACLRVHVCINVCVYVGHMLRQLVVLICMYIS